MYHGISTAENQNCATELCEVGRRTYILCEMLPSMPKCQNCSAHVTDQYARVFTPDEDDDPRVCPQCEDMTREGNGIREKRT